jgi:hypothetical protein
MTRLIALWFALATGCTPAEPAVDSDTDAAVDSDPQEDTDLSTEPVWVNFELATSAALYAVWAGPSTVWAYGSAGEAWKVAGQTQSKVDTDLEQVNFAGVYGRMVNEDPEITIVGDSGMVVRYVDGEFSSSDIGTANFLDVDAADGGERLTAVGWGGMYRWVDDAWVFVDLPGLVRLSAVRMGASVDFAVGDDGAILKSIGGAWSKETTEVTANLHAVEGVADNDVWAVGDRGTILHYDGLVWTSIASGTELTLWGVWVAPNGTVFAVGNNGMALKGGIDGFTRIYTGTDANLYAVAGRSATDVWAAGNRGTLIRYTGG